MIDESIRSLKEISNHLSPILTNFGLVRAYKLRRKIKLFVIYKIDINSTIGDIVGNYNIEVVFTE